VSFVTGSLDKQIRIWSYKKQMYGNIHMNKLGLKKWEFPYDWVKIKLNEIDYVFEILEKYEKDKKSEC